MTLIATNLQCQHQQRTLFAPCHFQLSAGQVVQLAGSNGVGKSTLLSALLGTHDWFGGTLLWCDQPVDHLWQADGLAVRFLGHRQPLYANLSVVENCRHLCLLWGCKVSDMAMESALKQWRLWPFQHRLVKQLSAGMSQRLLLAVLMAEWIERQCKNNQTDGQSDTVLCWILDEPSAHLDQAGVSQFVEMVEQLQHSGGCVLLTTHQSLNFSHDQICELHAAVV